MLATGLVVGEHAVAVLHCENFVVDASIIAVLVAEIVKLLTQFSDQLIFFTASDLNSRAGHASLPRVRT